MPPKFYNECRCIDDQLANILRKAIDVLVESDPKYSTAESDATYQHEQLRRELQAKLADLRSFGASQEQLKVLEANLMSKIPVSKEAEQIKALRKYVDECECDEPIHIDWMSFPYHQTSTYTGKTSTGSHVSRTKEEKLGDITVDLEPKRAHVQEVVSKVHDWYKNQGGLDELCKEYPSKALSWEDIKSEAVNRGIVSRDDMNKFMQYNNEIDKATGYNYRKWIENTLYRLRKDKGCPVKTGLFGRE